MTVILSSQKPPKVLLVIHTLSGGGVERTASYILNEIENFGIKAEAIVTYPGTEKYIKNSSNITVVPKRYRFDLRIDALAAAMKSAGPDIVHSIGESTLPGCFYAAKKAGVPTLIGSYINYYSYTDLASAVIALYARKTSGIFSNVPPELLRWPYSTFYKETKSAFLLNPVDTEGIKNARADLTPLDIPEGSRVILFAGRFVHQKNIPLLIRSFSKIAPSFRELVLVLCGTGPLKDKIQRMVKDSPFRDRIYLPGFRNDIWSLMKASEFLVLCSHFEGMPNILTEAMSAGIPIVASDIPVHRHLLNHGQRGLLASSNDAVDLAQKMIQLLQETPDEKGKRQEAATAYASKFSFQHTIKGFADYYKSFIT